MERGSRITRRRVIPSLRLHCTSTRTIHHVKLSTIFPFLEKANPKRVYISMRVLQRGKSIHKIVHNISLVQILPTTGDSGATIASKSPLLLLLLTQRSTSLHRYEWSTKRFKPRCDPTQRLSFPSLLLFFPCVEMSFVAFGLCCYRCTSVGFDVEYVRFESEWVDEVCVYVFWERVDVRWEFYLLVEARVDWETGSAEREMRRRNETLIGRKTLMCQSM